MRQVPFNLPLGPHHHTQREKIGDSHFFRLPIATGFADGSMASTTYLPYRALRGLEHFRDLSVAKLKNFLRKTKARTQETLEAAIAAALATITSHDARGWFKHCEFPLPLQSF